MPQQQHTEPPQLPQLQTQLSEATALRLLSRVTVSSAAPQLQQQQQEPPAQTQQPPDTETQLQTDTEMQLHPPETQSPEIQLLPQTPQQLPTTTTTEAQAETDNNICCTSAAGCGASTCVEPATGTSRQLGVVLTNTGQPTHSSEESVHSANEFGNSCRICRYNSSDMEIINCPCKCKGSVVSLIRDIPLPRAHPPPSFPFTPLSHRASYT